jgi:hypothetical protein
MMIRHSFHLSPQLSLSLFTFCLVSISNTMDRFQRFLQSTGNGMMMPGIQPGMDVPVNDTAEVVHISSLALLKASTINNDHQARSNVYIYRCLSMASCIVT